MHNNEKAVSVKVQHCEESFIGTSLYKKKKKKKGGSLPASYRKCWGPIIQKCDAVRSLQVLSSLLTPCQCCFLGNGTVEIFFFSFSFVPQMAWTKKKKKRRLHSWVAWGSGFITSPGRYIFNYRFFFFSGYVISVLCLFRILPLVSEIFFYRVWN